MPLVPERKLIKVADLYYWLARSIFNEELLGLSTYYFITTFLISLSPTFTLNLLKPTCYVMHQQFNIQQMFALPTL